MKRIALFFAGIAVVVGSLAVPSDRPAYGYSTPDQGAPCVCSCQWVPIINRFICFCVCDA